MSIMQLINLIVFCLVFDLLIAHFAKKRGRDPFNWFVIGLFLGVFGMVLLFCLPKVKTQKSTHTQPPRSPFQKRSESWLKMWYVLDASRIQQGPFEFPDLIKQWKEKAINETSYIWGEGMKEWQPLSELPELIKEIEQTAAVLKPGI